MPRNMNLVAAMIYSAFTHHFSEQIPLEDDGNNSLSSVNLGRRIFMRPCEHETCDSGLYSTLEGDKDKMIAGLPEAGEIPYFLEDKEGYPKVRNYILKIISNCHQVAKRRYVELKLHPTVAKISRRRKLIPSLQHSMPEYARKLTDWEARMIADGKVNQDWLEDDTGDEALDSSRL
jgi:hypothetical protein